MAVYADILFLINASMDIMLMILLSRWFHMKLKIHRLVTAGIIGGVYGVFACVFNCPNFLFLILNVLACALICYTAFSYPSRRHFIRAVAICYLLSAAFGGGIELFGRICKQLVMTGSSAYTWNRISLFYPAVILLFGLFLLGGSIIRSHTSEKSAEIIIKIAGNVVCLKGLIDSGNMLTEPISGQPVIVCNRNKCKIEPQVYRSRIRIIPVKTVMGSSVLYGCRSDSVLIKYGGKEYERSAVVAFTAEKLEPGCDAVIPEQLIN